MALVLQIAAEKLRPNLQAHQIMVLTNQPLQVTLYKPDLSDRMMKRAIKLSEYDIQYKPQLPFKEQVLIDFIAKLP